MNKIYFLMIPFFLSAVSCNNAQEAENLKDPVINKSVKKTDSSITIEKAVVLTDSVIALNTPIRAYINDPYDNGPTNIRKKPGGEVIQQLHSNENWIIHIHAKCGRWFMIKDINDFDTIITFPDSSGWLHGSVIEFGTRNYGGQPIKLYLEADNSADIVTQIKGESSVKLIDIEGKWVKVEYTNRSEIRFEGWIKRDWLCGNPHTNCC